MTSRFQLKRVTERLPSFARFLVGELFGADNDLSARICRFSLALSWPDLVGLVSSQHNRSASA
jgi:hypothetical protein